MTKYIVTGEYKGRVMWYFAAEEDTIEDARDMAKYYRMAFPTWDRVNIYSIELVETV